MHWLTAGLTLTVLALLPFHPIRAEGNPDAVRGIVAEDCTTCHEVPGYRSRRNDATLMGLPFRSIANQPAVYTRARLTAFLRRPHYPMTKFTLSPSDIDNLIAFIQSLREE